MTPGDIVWVPFPHVETNQLHSRPALIVAAGLAGDHDLCWALMITAAANAPLTGDVQIVEERGTGLPIASRVRTGKIATITASSATPIGRLSEKDWARVCAVLADTFGYAVR